MTTKKLKPLFIMMVGLPGSGKSEIAEELEVLHNCKIMSSDTTRIELFGSDYNYDPADNQTVFSTLHKNIRTALIQGQNVIYDATNIKMKTRIKFISKTLADIDCRKVCYYVAKPIDQCLEYVQTATDGYVNPVDVIRMYMNLQIPYYYEGWDNIRIVRTGQIKDSTRWLFRNDETGLNNTYITYTNIGSRISVGTMSQYMQLVLKRSGLPKHISSAALFSLIGYNSIVKHLDLFKQLNRYSDLNIEGTCEEDDTTFIGFHRRAIEFNHLFNMSAQDSIFYSNKTYFGPLRFINDKLVNQRYSLDVAILIQWLMIDKRYSSNLCKMTKLLGDELMSQIYRINEYMNWLFDTTCVEDDKDDDMTEDDEPINPPEANIPESDNDTIPDSPSTDDTQDTNVSTDDTTKDETDNMVDTKTDEQDEIATPSDEETNDISDESPITE